MSDRIQAGAANGPGKVNRRAEARYLSLRTALGAIVLASVSLGGVALVPAALAAQEPWPLQPTSRTERVIAPFLEGWYLNDDETITYSFGYLNMNEETVEIPIGEGNSIEPTEFSGMQPTVFLPGRKRGMFTVTVPASMREEDVWWRITNSTGRVTEVPGSTSWDAYRLDWAPRPHGTVPPEVSFEGGQRPVGPGLGPAGVLAERTVTTTVGAPTTLAVHVEEISMSPPDETDPTLLAGRTPLRVVWTPYQAPIGASVSFSPHESTPDFDAGLSRGWRHEGPDCYAAVPCAIPGDGQIVVVASGEGTAHVVATFSEPGDYLVHAQVNNFGRPDSGFTDQCCFTNGFVRVTVGPR